MARYRAAAISIAARAGTTPAGAAYASVGNRSILAGALSGPVSAFPDDLLAAALAALQVLLGTKDIAWVGTGQVPPKTLPSARVGSLDETADYDEDGSGHAPYDDEGTLPIVVTALTAAAAKAAGLKVEKALTDAPLLFADGELLQLRRSSRGSPVYLGDYPGNAEVYAVHLMFETITSRTL